MCLTCVDVLQGTGGRRECVCVGGGGGRGSHPRPGLMRTSAPGGRWQRRPPQATAPQPRKQAKPKNRHLFRCCGPRTASRSLGPPELTSPFAATSAASKRSDEAAALNIRMLAVLFDGKKTDQGWGWALRGRRRGW
jgi:hypothetical protein